jgi:hypothetical protein
LAAGSKQELLQRLARLRAADELLASVATGACSVCKESLQANSLLAYRLVGVNRIVVILATLVAVAEAGCSGDPGHPGGSG